MATSHEIGGMISGQQAMFGNFASYATQISPYAPGVAPGYGNPFGGTSNPFRAPPPPTPGAAAIGGAFNVGLPALAMGASIATGIDPFTMGLRAFKGGAGISGGTGLLQGLTGITRAGGLGGLARAGMSGLGMAGASMLPFFLASQASSHIGGQMLAGAQFQGQVNNVLGSTFRMPNPSAVGGFGFNKGQKSEIAGMLEEMGTGDMFTSPTELLNIMQKGGQMGLFRAVQDMKQFKSKFKELKNTLATIATEMNTTLEEAMPMLQEGRGMGFWTPTDVTKFSRMARATAGIAGMSVSNTNAMMARGAAISRSIGGMGAAGAESMSASLGLTGAALGGGYISEAGLSEATGGLMGEEAVGAFGGAMTAGVAKFARSRRGRWVLAAMANKDMSGLDASKMSLMSSGGLGIGAIGSMARKNVAGFGNAKKFLMNEEELRGELMSSGPEGALGFVRAAVGERLFDKDSLSAERFMMKSMGMDRKSARLMAEMARNLPRIRAARLARTEALADATATERDAMMKGSWDAIEKKIGTWWDQNIDSKIREVGRELSLSVDSALENAGNSLLGVVGAPFGVTPAVRLKGDVGAATRALTAYALTGARSEAMAGLGSGSIDSGSLTGPGLGRLASSGFVPESTTSTNFLGLTTRSYSKEAIRKAGTLAGITGGAGVSGEGAAAMGFGSLDAFEKGAAGAKAEYESILRSRDAGSIRSKDPIERAKALGALAKPGGALSRFLKGASADQLAARLGSLETAGGYTTGLRGLMEGMDLGGESLDLASVVERSESAFKSAGEGLNALYMGVDSSESWKIASLDPRRSEATGYSDLKDIFESGDADVRAAAKRLVDPNSSAADKEAAANLLNDYANREDSPLSEGGKKAVRAITGKGALADKGLMGKLSAVADSVKLKDRAALTATVNSRITRLRGALGEEAGAMAKSLGGRGGTAFKNLLGIGEKKLSTLEDRADELTELASSILEMDDPTKALSIAEKLKETPGGSEMGLTIARAVELAGMAKPGVVSAEEETRLKAAAGKGKIGKKFGAKAGLVRDILSNAGISGLGKDQLNALIAGTASEKMMAELVDSTGVETEEGRRIMRETLTSASGGFTKEELSKGLMARASSAAGTRTHSTELYDRTGVSEKTLEKRLGKLGSTEGMHQELTVIAQTSMNQLEVLKQIKDGGGITVAGDKSEKGATDRPDSYGRL